MIKFDKDGWIVGQVVKTVINHEYDHDRFYYDVKSSEKYDKSKYTIHDHTTHMNYEEDLQIVPLCDTSYSGKKYEEWNKKGSGALALIGKSTRSNKMLVVKILIPKIKDE